MNNLKLLNGVFYGKKWAVNPEREQENGLVVVRRGAVPATIESPKMEGLFFKANDEECLIDVKDISKIYISRGEAITYELYPGCPEDEVFAFISSFAATALLLQQGRYLIHGGSFVLKNQVILISGPAGAGKSTLQAHFHNTGAKFIADEISVVDFDENGLPMLVPGFPFIRVWKDMAKKLKIDCDPKRKLRSKINKFLVDTRSEIVSEPVALRKLFLLNQDRAGAEIEIEELKGKQKITLAMEAVYRPNWIDQLGKKTHYFFTTAKMAGKINVYRITRPEGKYTVENLAEKIEELCV